MSDEKHTPITLQPGLMVALHTQVRGGVEYTRKDLNAKEGDMAATIEVGGSATVERWETVKVTEDAEEHARATKVRSKCRQTVESVCIKSPFGLLCTKAREEELLAAIASARAHAAAFNETAKRTFVDVWIMRGQIVANDTDAVKGIAAEVRSLLAEMDSGIGERDAEKIREAARRAQALQAMLDAAHAEKVRAAVAEARAAAREVAKAVKDRGEAARDLILVADQIAAKKAMSEARAAFLDVGDAAPVEALAVPSVRALDVDEGDGGEVVPIVEKRGVEELGEGDDLGDADASRAVDEDAAGMAASGNLEV